MRAKRECRHKTLTDELKHHSKMPRKIKMVFFFITIVSLTFQQLLANGRKLHHTYVSISLKTNTFLRLEPSYVFLSPEPQSPRLQICPDYIFSFQQTSVFYLPLSFHILPPCNYLPPSLFCPKLPSRARETILTCDTNFPT